MEPFLMSALKRFRRRQRGITLIELLVVLTILALISALVVVNVLPEADKAAAKKAKIDLDTIQNALDQYRLDMFTYPTTEQGLQALVTLPPDDPRADQFRPGGYLRAVPVDPWGKPYQYRQPGQHGPIDLFSLGADGVEGGEGVNADIVNWTPGQ
jgi:general secretion pathway protein G